MASSEEETELPSVRGAQDGGWKDARVHHGAMENHGVSMVKFVFEQGIWSTDGELFGWIRDDPKSSKMYQNMLDFFLCIGSCFQRKPFCIVGLGGFGKKKR